MTKTATAASIKTVDSPSSARNIVLRHTQRSFIELSNDSQIPAYITKMIEEVAAKHGKTTNDVSWNDIERIVDNISSVLATFNMDELKLSSLQQFATKAGNVYNLSKLALLIWDLSQGKFAYLLEQGSLHAAKPKLRRAGIVFLAGMISEALYSDISFQELITPHKDVIDPFFLMIDHPTLMQISVTLGMKAEKAAKTSETELAHFASSKFRNEAKVQELTSAWFPANAESYFEALAVVAKSIKADISSCTTVKEVESAICMHSFRMLLDRLSEDEKRKITDEWIKQHPALGQKFSLEKILSAGSLSAWQLANSAGFLPYMATSSLVGTLSHAVGLTLPFSAYMSLSSALSGALGPVGAAVSITPIVFEIYKSKPERLVPAVALIAAFRNEYELRAQRENRRLARRKFALSLVATAFFAFAVALVVYHFSF